MSVPGLHPDAGPSTVDAGPPTVDAGPPTMDAGCSADIETDPDNCGACGVVCSATAPSQATCSAGRCLITLAFGLDRPNAIQVDEANVYWDTLNASGGVYQLPVGGGTPVTLADAEAYPIDIWLDTSFVYWALNVEEGAIKKVPIGGGQVLTLATNQPYPQGLSGNTTNLYWGTYGLEIVAYESFAGGTPITINMGGVDDRVITTVADDTSVYWTQSVMNMNSIVRAPMTGGAPTTLWNPGLTLFLNDMIESGSRLYWTDATRDLVLSMSIEGGAAVTVAAGQNSPQGLVADRNFVYWGNASGSLVKCPLAGGDPITLLENQPSIHGVAVNGTSLFWTTQDGDNPTGTIMELTPK